MLATDKSSAARVADHLRLSHKDSSTLSALVSGRSDPAPFATTNSARRFLYSVGRERFRDLVLLEWAASPTFKNWADFLEMANSWVPPDFPLTGDDVAAMGVAHGPEIGRILRIIEDWWIDQAFAPGRDSCIERLRNEVMQDN